LEWSRSDNEQGQQLIYICIPTHNEQQTVGVVLWKLRQVLTEYPRDYQILVADDASTDKTQEVLEPYTRVLPLTVIRSETQQGYAASLEMLLREASRRSEYPKRDVIVTLQADFSEEPDDLVPLIKRMEAGADVALGTKVSAAPQTRLRRWARALSNFFARGQTWPEAVATPFDGFRAYRLHAVKNAIEARPGQRLLRYPGWAGHAELLRAVLPHARRVDAVEVEDRADRLQRPRRERPFAAALEVRAMMRNTEPEGLVGVEALDRLAATASRSRDRSLAVNGTSNGAPRSQSDRDRRPGRDRERPEGRSRSTRSDGRGDGRGEGAKGSAGSGNARRGEESRRPPRSQKSGEAGPAGGDSRRRNPPTPTAAAAVAAPDDETTTTAAIQADGSEAPPAPKKKRRRRRGRGGGGGSAAAGEASGADESVAGSAEVAGEGPIAGGAADGATADGGADGEAGTDGAQTERKRRRRGGRRGGRGRRRTGAADGTADASAEASADAEPGDGGSADGAGTARTAPATAPAPPASVIPSAPAAEARSDQE
jgi:hypothetical protein